MVKNNNMKKFILLSLLLHFLISGLLTLSFDNKNILFNIKEGLANIKTQKNPDVPVDINNQYQHRQLNILVNSKSEVVYSLAKNKNKKSLKTTDQNKSNSAIGALYKKADSLLENQPPDYPYLARKLGQQGKVSLNIQIMPNGKTGEIEIAKSSGHSLIDNAAKNAAESWKFFEKKELAFDKAISIAIDFEFIIKNQD